METTMRSAMALSLVLTLSAALPMARADDPAPFAVQARLVDAGESAKPDKAPEQWITAAVTAAMGEARRPKPKNVEALTDWIPLSLEKPTTIKSGGLSITVTIRQEKPLQIGLAMSSGNANAEAAMTLDAVPSSRKAQVTAYQQYLAVEVLKAPATKPAATLQATLEVGLKEARATLETLLPPDMVVSRAEMLDAGKGVGILLQALPKDGEKVHPSFAMFLWPKDNPADIAYETGEGAHTFRRIGESAAYKVYYSCPSGFMLDKVRNAFCAPQKEQRTAASVNVVEATDCNAATKPAASRLRQVKLVAGMKRLEAERLIADATGVASKYDLHAMDTSKEVTYRDGDVALVVRYKPGAPAPWIKTPDGRMEHLPPTDGEVLSWEFPMNGEAASQPARLFDTKCDKEGDAIEVVAEAGKTVLRVTSKRGIGGATITRTGDHWPKEMVLRMHLSGLEQFAIGSGEVRLRASVLSHSGHMRMLRLWTKNEEGPPLDKDSPYWMGIAAFDAQGKPIDGLPPKGGWFEMTVPKGMLVDQEKVLELGWIDFFRR